MHRGHCHSSEPLSDAKVVLIDGGSVLEPSAVDEFIVVAYCFLLLRLYRLIDSCLLLSFLLSNEICESHQPQKSFNELQR